MCHAASRIMDHFRRGQLRCLDLVAGQSLAGGLFRPKKLVNIVGDMHGRGIVLGGRRGAQPKEARAKGKRRRPRPTRCAMSRNLVSSACTLTQFVRN